ncbi:MAG: two-component system CheB/CheR fusion protein, partial [Gammaproteobacteria bacterium]
GNTALNALQKIYLILRTQTDHDFSLYKKNTICRRIERRMTVNQINEIDDYVRYLQESEREAAILFKELLIGVTNFFRDPIIFASLSELLVRKLLVGKPHQYTLRVWVAGCSSGEEAYSIAIILQECMQQLDRHFNVQIFATDIDEEAISVARQGIYPESIQADVSPERLSRYFTKENDGRYRIHKTTREMLVFAPQNLTKDPPFTNLDLLCCRNLLIYLGPELQKKLLQVFHYSLRKGGMLFLGSSETIGQGGTELFSALDKKGKIFRRKPSTTPAHSDLTFPAVPTTISVESLLIPEQIRQAEEISALQLVESILKQSNTSPCVIIDDQSNIVYIHGQTGRFLEPAEGKISVNILKMARLGLRVVLAAAIRKVATHKQEVTHRGLEMESEGKTIHLDLVVRPILEQSVMRGMMMIIFEDSNKAKKNKKSPPTPQRIESLNKTAKELSLELDYTKENLQTTIEELETTNEELKSTNEELQSTNEELQSTNEEMETSKEELQSLNEESVTVNSELQSRIDELSIANDDMKNLLDSTDIATVFLDTNLCIRRFTPSATEIIPLAGSDSGRPIKHFATILIDTDLTEYGRLVLQDLEVREAEVKSRDGRFFFMRVRPYRTTNNVIDGVIVTFEDISIRMKDEQSIKEVVGRYKILFDMVGDSIVVVDLETGRFKESNKQARTRLGYTKKEFEQLSIADIETADSPLKEMQHMAKAGKKRNNTYETRHKAKDGTITDVVVKAMAIKFGDKKHLLCTWNDMPENSTTME